MALDEDGLCVDELEEILSRLRPKFLYTMPTFHNPGGCVMSMERRLQLIDVAKRHGLVTFGLGGYRGGKLKELQDDGLHVDLNDMGMVESIHLCVFHWVLNDVYARINAEGRHAG